MFVGPCAVVDGFRAVAVKDTCWTMVEESKTGPWLRNMVTKTPVVVIMTAMMVGPFSSSSSTADIIRESLYNLKDKLEH